MWKSLADQILRYRWVGLGFVFALTVFMAYYGVVHMEVSQEYLNVIPPDDPDVKAYRAFVQEFGEEGNTMIVAMEHPKINAPQNNKNNDTLWYQKEFLNDLYHLSRQIQKAEGTKRVLNLTCASMMTVNESAKRFEMTPFMTQPFAHDSQIVRLKEDLREQIFYEGLLFSNDRSTLLTAISFTAEAMNGKQKHRLQKEIEKSIAPFQAKYGLEIRYAGVPYLRTYMTRRLPTELGLFVLSSLLVTALALFYFYRTLYSVIFPLLLLLICSICTLGIVALMGYKLTLLMGMLPAIIIILGIPPSIYMLSDYLEEYKIVQDKRTALRNMVDKLGLVTFMINANTAFGFLTLYFTDIQPLREFGLTAFVGTLLSYVLTIFLIPGVFSILPPPSAKNVKQIEIPVLRRFVSWMNEQVRFQKKYIYGITLGVLVVACAGTFRLQAISFMQDDLPQEVVTQLNFLESRTGGVLPFEIVIDFQKDGAAKKLNNLKLIAELQDSLDTDPRLSRTISIVDALKWSRQAMYGGESIGYELPARNEMDLIARYMQGAQVHKDSTKKNKIPLTSNLTDTAFRKARITGYVKDLGSKQMPDLIEQTEKQIQSIFSETPVRSLITGTTRIFLKMNEYLIDNLVWSLLATFLIIGLQMWVLFASFRVMLISLAVNIIPLAVTAGIMGYFNIPLKPSTALIYELAFGIAIDNSIHYLTAYRYYRKKGESLEDAITSAGRVTGMGIVFTSIVLFLGFGVFMFSAFGSTQSLGLLTSVTLLTAMFSNLLLMPALVLHFDKKISYLKSKALIDNN